MNRTLVLGACGCLILITAATAWADPQCDEYMRKYGGPCLAGVPSDSKTIRTGILPKKHRTIGGFELGPHSFPEAAKIFGDATRWATGDAAASESKVCYSTSAPAGPMTLVLAQNSEMSDRIDEIRLIAGAVGFSEHCKKLAPAERLVQTQSGIHLGMSEKELVNLLGSPTLKNDGLLIYSWAKEREVKKDDPTYSSCVVNGHAVETLGSGITARFVEGVLAWVAIGLSTGYVC